MPSLPDSTTEYGTEGPDWTSSPKEQRLNAALLEWDDLAVSLEAWKEPRTTALARELWIAERVRSALVYLREATEIDPRKLGGIPVVAGTRFSIAQLLAEIAEGQSINEITDDFELDTSKVEQILRSLSIYLDRPFLK